MLLSTVLFAFEVGEVVPSFTLQDHDGKSRTIAPNQSKKWTVLYFYPKADTPGCTAQACAFRDAIKVIEKENAHVYGISTNTVKELKEFQNKYKLNFTLLSDPDAAICKKFGAKMLILKMSRRYTFILDADLRIRAIDRDVDPAMDAKKVAERLKALQAIKGSIQKEDFLEQQGRDFKK
jgi:peroxiredoxin Q/BCP